MKHGCASSFIYHVILGILGMQKVWKELPMVALATTLRKATRTVLSTLGMFCREDQSRNLHPASFSVL